MPTVVRSTVPIGLKIIHSACSASGRWISQWASISSWISSHHLNLKYNLLVQMTMLRYIFKAYNFLLISSHYRWRVSSVIAIWIGFKGIHYNVLTFMHQVSLYHFTTLDCWLNPYKYLMYFEDALHIPTNQAVFHFSSFTSWVYYMCLCDIIILMQSVDLFESFSYTDSWCTQHWSWDNSWALLWQYYARSNGD